MQPLIITVAVTGAEVTREHNPNLPITPEEIVKAAVECYDAGASVVHVHVRDPKTGKPSSDVNLFKQVLEGIRAERPDMIVQFSTGGAIGMTEEERMAHLVLKPDMATLNMGTMNFGEEVFINPLPYIRKLAARMNELGIKPEVEIYDVGMIATAKRLIKEGLLKEPVHFDLVMGVPGGIPATVENLLILTRNLPPNSTWGVAAIGRHQLPMNVAAIILGGHVRTGFEDNVYYRKGELAKSNAQLVERIVRIANELNRPVATAQQAREILGLTREEK